MRGQGTTCDFGVLPTAPWVLGPHLPQCQVHVLWSQTKFSWTFLCCPWMSPLVICKSWCRLTNWMFLLMDRIKQRRNMLTNRNSRSSSVLQAMHLQAMTSVQVCPTSLKDPRRLGEASLTSWCTISLSLWKFSGETHSRQPLNKMSAVAPPAARGAKSVFFVHAWKMKKKSRLTSAPEKYTCPFSTLVVCD